MSTPSVDPGAPRPRPILLAQSILAALGLVTGSAGFADQIPAGAAWWIITGLAGINLGLGFYLQSVSTSLSAPQDHRGVPLIPEDIADARVLRAARTGSTNPTNPTNPTSPPAI